MCSAIPRAARHAARLHSLRGGPGGDQPERHADALRAATERYFLYVGRLEPENRVHDLVEAAREAQADMPTVVVGDAPYASEYIAKLRSRAGDAVRFTGAIYGDGYWELIQHAYTYVFPVMSSGTHPALIEAMACGNCVLVRDTPDNRNVGGDAWRRHIFSNARRIERADALGHRHARRSGATRRTGRRTRTRPLRLGPRTCRLSRSGPQGACDARMIVIGPKLSAATQDVVALAFGRATALTHAPDMDGYRADFRVGRDHPRPGAVAGAARGVRRADARSELDAWLLDQAAEQSPRLDAVQDELLETLAALRRAHVRCLPLKGAALLCATALWRTPHGRCPISTCWWNRCRTAARPGAG